MNEIYYFSLGVAAAALIYYFWLLAGGAAKKIIEIFDSWSQGRRK